jgi:hypothetical protein
MATTAISMVSSAMVMVMVMVMVTLFPSKG